MAVCGEALTLLGQLSVTPTVLLLLKYEETLKFPLLTKLLPKAYHSIPAAYQKWRKFNYSCNARTMAMYGLLHTNPTSTYQ